MIGERLVKSVSVGDKKYEIVMSGGLYSIRDDSRTYFTVYPDGGYVSVSICEDSIISMFNKLLVCLLNEGNEEKLMEYEVFGGVVLSCYSVGDSVRAKLSDGDSYLVIGEDRSIVINKGMDNKHIAFLLEEMNKLKDIIKAYGSLHKQVAKLYNKMEVVDCEAV